MCRPPALPLAVLLYAAAPACAQSASIRVTHDDPDGTVTPGESVQITTTISWQAPGQSALWEIGGSVRAAPDLGLASNNVFPYGPLPGFPTIVAGTPALGSVHGVYLKYGSLNWWLFGFPPSEPWSYRFGFEVVRFDWTAPATPGIVDFDWMPSATLAEPYIASSQWSPAAQPVSTTYFGTSLTVIPAPPAGASLFLASLVLSIHRRR